VHRRASCAAALLAARAGALDPVLLLRPPQHQRMVVHQRAAPGVYLTLRFGEIDSPSAHWIARRVQAPRTAAYVLQHGQGLDINLSVDPCDGGKGRGSEGSDRACATTESEGGVSVLAALRADVQLCFGDVSGHVCRHMNDAAMYKSTVSVERAAASGTHATADANDTGAGVEGLVWAPGSMVRAPGGRILLKLISLSGFSLGTHSMALWLQAPSGRHLCNPMALHFEVVTRDPRLESDYDVVWTGQGGGKKGGDDS